MEIDSTFWNIHKKSLKFKGILTQNDAVPFFHLAFQYKDTFMYSDQILVSSTSFYCVTGSLCVVFKGETGGSHGCGTCLFHGMKHVKGP